jgi:hypothetical protein
MKFMVFVHGIREDKTQIHSNLQWEEYTHARALPYAMSHCRYSHTYYVRRSDSWAAKKAVGGSHRG